MKVLYAITCHQMNNPLKHTVKYLSSFKENIILIHVDKKSNLNDFKSLQSSNVHFISNRINITWGSFTQIKSVLELMKASLNFSYDYFFLLSGDDIPLKHDNELKKLLSLYSDYNFISFDKKITEKSIQQRVLYTYPKVFYKRNNKLFTKIQKKAFLVSRNIIFKNKSFIDNHYRMPKLYKGTNWFGLKKTTIQYILEYLKKNDWFLSVFDSSFCCDEVIFHTIIKTDTNIKLFNHDEYPIPSLRYIDWQSGPEFPRVLTELDKDNMIASNCFFARKIQADASSDFMEYFLSENKINR